MVLLSRLCWACIRLFIFLLISLPVLAQSNDLALTSLCEEGENQFRWLVENNSDKAMNFNMKATDDAGYVFDGTVGPQASIFVITYRKVTLSKGADTWKIKSGKFSQNVDRVTDSCRFMTEPPPPPPVCPPEPEPVICPPPPEPTVCPPIPEPTVCEPNICPPPPEPTICPPEPEPVVCPEPPAASLPHSCMAASDPFQDVEPLDVAVRVRTDLRDNLSTLTYFEDITFQLQTCESMSISGRFSQTTLKNTFTLDSQLIVGTQAEEGATRIALMAGDGTIIYENGCSAESCILTPFLVKDLQGNFGLASQSTFYIVIDYMVDGVLMQKGLVFNTY